MCSISVSQRGLSSSRHPHLPLIKSRTRSSSPLMISSLLPHGMYVQCVQRHVLSLTLSQRDHGWRTAKRPGVDYFLAYISQFYEVVIFSTQPSYVRSSSFEGSFLTPHRRATLLSTNLTDMGSLSRIVSSAKQLAWLMAKLSKICPI